ncbi:BON domain-containing protein [uncultured Nevskia sp.]|uniref:BON domain-containing protein n=1 Tax=uncultured Nevskia sp. TaxID=228950 RepID=UPI0025E3062B|nr:BON domain-containing protein [uncultured Nevskia sp.]
MKTDIQIQKDVLAELNWEPSVNAATIGVEVKGGIVTLTGNVGSYADKWHAEAAAQRVEGVMALTVEIEVTLPGPSKRTDVDIARSAENVLQWTSYLSKDSIKVMVENGWVTLSGEVEWQYQRVTAATSVRYLMGVTGLSNNIAIRPKLTSKAVKTDIEAALKRRATAHPDRISVDVRGGDVTLSGTVNSWAEREVAKTSAWGTPGVNNVVDKLTVAY